MTCEEARTRFVDLWKGTLEDSAFEFHAHLATCERCRTEAEQLQSVWSSLAELPELEPSQRVRLRFYDSLRDSRRRESERQERFWWSRHPAFQVAFAMLILMAGIGIGHFTVNTNTSEVAQLRGEVSSMRQMVALSLLQQQNASDRLRGVNWAYRVEPPDPEVVSALLTTITQDSNVNVRLAAVDALRTFSGNPEVRKALVQALPKEDSPLVQIAILDQMVDLHERSAVPSIRFLLSRSDINPDVKQRAGWAERQLQ